MARLWNFAQDGSVEPDVEAYQQWRRDFSIPAISSDDQKADEEYWARVNEVASNLEHEEKQLVLALIQKNAEAIGWEKDVSYEELSQEEIYQVKLVLDQVLERTMAQEKERQGAAGNDFQVAGQATTTYFAPEPLCSSTDEYAVVHAAGSSTSSRPAPPPPPPPPPPLATGERAGNRPSHLPHPPPTTFARPCACPSGSGDTQGKTANPGKRPAPVSANDPEKKRLNSMLFHAIRLAVGDDPLRTDFDKNAKDSEQRLQAALAAVTGNECHTWKCVGRITRKDQWYCNRCLDQYYSKKMKSEWVTVEPVDQQQGSSSSSQQQEDCVNWGSEWPSAKETGKVVSDELPEDEPTQAQRFLKDAETGMLYEDWVQCPKWEKEVIEHGMPQSATLGRQTIEHKLPKKSDPGEATCRQCSKEFYLRTHLIRCHLDGTIFQYLTKEALEHSADGRAQLKQQEEKMLTDDIKPVCFFCLTDLWKKRPELCPFQDFSQWAGPYYFVDHWKTKDYHWKTEPPAYVMLNQWTKKSSKSWHNPNAEKKGTANSIIHAIASDVAERAVNGSGEVDRKNPMDMLSKAMDIVEKMRDGHKRKLMYGADFHGEISHELGLYIIYVCGCDVEFRNGAGGEHRGCDIAFIGNNKWIVFTKRSGELLITIYEEVANDPANAFPKGSHYFCPVCSQRYLPKWSWPRRLVMWTNMSVDATEARSTDQILIAFAGSAHQQYPLTQKCMADEPEHVQKGHALWKWVEDTIGFLKTMRLATELKDMLGNVVVELSLQLVFSAVVSINETMTKKFKRHSMVEKFFSKIPDASDVDQRRLYVQDASLTTTLSGAVLWGIDLKTQFGDNYATDGSIPYMTAEEWQELLEVVLGFVDMEPLYEQYYNAAKARQAKRKATGGNAKLDYNQTERAFFALHSRRSEFSEKCCAQAPLLRDAFDKMFKRSR